MQTITHPLGWILNDLRRAAPDSLRIECDEPGELVDKPPFQAVRAHLFVIIEEDIQTRRKTVISQSDAPILTQGFPHLWWPLDALSPLLPCIPRTCRRA